MTQKLFTRNFSLLILGQLTSLFGNYILKLALSMHVLEVTGSAAIFAGILSAATIPTILLSPLGGVLADRADRRNIMVALDALTGFSVLCAALLLSGENDLTVISILLVILSVLSDCSHGGRFSVLHIRFETCHVHKRRLFLCHRAVRMFYTVKLPAYSRRKKYPVHRQTGFSFQYTISVQRAALHFKNAVFNRPFPLFCHGDNSGRSALSCAFRSRLKRETLRFRGKRAGSCHRCGKHCRRTFDGEIENRKAAAFALRPRPLSVSRRNCLPAAMSSRRYLCRQHPMLLRYANCDQYIFHLCGLSHTAGNAQLSDRQNHGIHLRHYPVRSADRADRIRLSF